ncbi:MAG: C4-dicarboxylate ABC transporter, partial [Pseudomonadota bacterium]
LDEVTEARNTAAFEVNEQNKQLILDQGGTVRQLNADQRQAWVDAMKPVWKKFEADVPAELVDAAQAANAGG